MSSSSSMNKYWIPHLDIHKKVITQELQYYLGPEATVRSFTRDGEDGFLITTPGPCLTDVSHRLRGETRSDRKIDSPCIRSK
ncbi:hypothetical protein F5144DRAFT_601491 [Chaetomium tenue]|uniref:Uncharacterized protein n=1 Tax=Chaetomium tenue TaxID=1854479 RepID=A0ACB7PEN0_9PEZI|nr:hypothetical protein F5144DRAFT_601491 [Chaetomium globosum]